MAVNTYAVTLAHDSGRVTLRLAATSSDAAATIAAEVEGAPASAVVSVVPVS